MGTLQAAAPAELTLATQRTEPLAVAEKESVTTARAPLTLWYCAFGAQIQVRVMLYGIRRTCHTGT